MITAIKDFKIKQYYTSLVSKIIINYLREFIYQPLYDIATNKPKALNALTPEETIIEALKSGVIYYEDGAFKTKNKFSNEIASILELWGAKYNKVIKGYKISREKLGENVLFTLAQKKIQAEDEILKFNTVLNDIQNNLDGYVDKMIFDDDVEVILEDAQKEIKKNTRKISVIIPELDEQQKEEIAQAYTNNLQYNIKDFEDERIPKMRQKVQELALKGYRPDAVADMLQEEYGIMQRKAKFLAQNETSIMLAEFKRVTYKKMGFDKFIWKTITDGKERERHKELNNTVWSYDDPPYIDENKTRKGLPGEDYNCRCEAIPFRDDNIFSQVTHKTFKDNDMIKIKDL